MNDALIDAYGHQWARNKENIEALRSRGNFWGVYVLCDGSMPIYIGRGRIAKRVAQHQRSKTKGQAWDHFSWYAVRKRKYEADVEALLLRMLPYYLRSLNKKRTEFVAAERVKQECGRPQEIKRLVFAQRRRRRS